MGENFHIYSSDFLSESRIMREARAIESFGLFSHIRLVGIRGFQLPDREEISAGITLHRLGPGKLRFTARLGPFGRMLWLFLWNLSVLWFCLRRPVDCVNCHHLPMLPLCVLIKYLKGAKIVYDAHELETETGYSRGLRKSLAKRIEAMFIHRCDAHVFVGQAIADWYKDRYGLEHVSVVYNAPATQKMIPLDPGGGLRRRLNIPAHQLIVLYQGLLGPGRGIETLIEAVRGQGEFCLVFLGFGPLEGYVKQIAADDPGIFFHERVSHETLLALTATADLGISLIEPISLSYEYCAPNKLFEYMAAGVPVIVSPTTEQRAIVETYGSGIVAGSCSVRDARAALLTASTLDKAPMVAGCQAAMRHFSWENQTDSLRRLYQRLI